MTEERKEYLASISKEEKLIRFALDESKYLLKMAKYEIKFYNRGLAKIVVHHRINALTKIIKALKKQLPAPRKEYQNWYLDYCLCPICRWYANRERGYCPNCGQKLR